MGYVTKEELIEKLKNSNLFNEKQILWIDSVIETHRELDGDIVLKLGAINEMEVKGILGDFYRICKQNNYFPKWVENIESGIDHI